jgi:hypothetical protein
VSRALVPVRRRYLGASPYFTPWGGGTPAKPSLLEGNLLDAPGIVKELEKAGPVVVKVLRVPRSQIYSRNTFGKFCCALSQLLSRYPYFPPDGRGSFVT